MDEASEALKPNQGKGIEAILSRMDEALVGKEGIMPSDAWRYREEVRAKYQLPECGYRWNDPTRFISEIEAFIRKEGIAIRPKHDFERFFSEYPKAQAVTLEKGLEKTTVVVSESSQEESSSILLKDLIEELKKQKTESNQWSANTVRNYQPKINTMLQVLGNGPVNHITVDDTRKLAQLLELLPPSFANMKEYKDKKSTLIVGGTAQDFLGEYMAGGILILLGLNLRQGKSHKAKFIGTGMHGGVIYIRGNVEEYQLGKEVGVAELDENDTRVLRKLTGEFAGHFGYKTEEILKKDFIKLYPRSLRPYGRLYAY